MDNSTLKKVQQELLAILEDIDAVCKKNNINYFLDSGTLLGAVRHQGYIPWDDDIDIGMLRADYKRFCEIAQKDFGDKYFWQTWDTDSEYDLPIGKVRKTGTTYVELKAKEYTNCGFYVDVIPYDYAPDNGTDFKRLKTIETQLFRLLLMKGKYRTWIDNGKVNYKKRIGYFIYQLVALCFSRDYLIKAYKKVVNSVPPSDSVYQQMGKKAYRLDWMTNYAELPFEGRLFPVIKHYDEWLKTAYGNYWELPPENERENRHQIVKLDFGIDIKD